MEALVHIGYHKTASTWFQQNLYPKVSNHHFVDRRTVQQIFTKPRAFDFNPEDGMRILSEFEADKLILCEEKLSGNFHSGSLHGLISKEMADRVHQVLPRSKIVIFIRNQLTLIPSAYSQYIKRGGTCKLKDYIFPLYNDSYLSPRFSLDNLVYNDLIDHYTDLFGKDNVHIYRYEDFASDNKNFIDNFCNKFNIEHQLDIDEISKRVNLSYDLKSIRSQRIANLFSDSPIVPHNHLFDAPRFREYITNMIRRRSQKRTMKIPITIANLSSDEFSQRIESRFKKPNRDLNDKYDLDLDRYGYPL